MKKKYTSSGITPILIILLIAFIGIGGYLLGTQKNIFQTLQGTPSPTTTPDQTANWKTYTNSNPEYSISYPDDWIVDSSNATMSSKSGSVLLISKNGHTLKIYMPTGYGPGVCLFKDSPDFNKEMEGPYGKCPGNFTEFSGAQISFRRLDIPTTKDISVSWSVYTKDPSGSWVTVPILSYSAPLAFDANLVKTMDQILSTFKITIKSSAKATPSPEVLPKRKLSYVLPSGWQTTNTIENLFTIGYDPELWEAACPEYFGKSCKLILKTDRSYQFWTFQISTVNYSGGSRRAVLQDRYGTVHDEFEEVELSGIKGVGTIFRQPMEAGGNKYVAGFPVGNKMIIFTSSVLNTYSGKDSGFDLSYIYKVLSTLQIK